MMFANTIILSPDILIRIFWSVQPPVTCYGQAQCCDSVEFTVQLRQWAEKKQRDNLGFCLSASQSLSLRVSGVLFSVIFLLFPIFIYDYCR